MPYAPGQQYDFSPLAQGIAQFGKNIQAFTQKTKEDSQKSASLRKVMSLYAPERKDEFNAMGLKDLEAESAAHAAKRQMEQDQLQQQIQQSQLANQSADNTRADQLFGLNLAQFERSKQTEDQRRADDEALKGAVQMFARDWAQGPPQALAPEARQRYEGPTGSFKFAAEQNPIALMHPAIQALFHYMPKQDEQQALNAEFSEDPATGARFFHYGRQVLPSGINPNRAANTTAIPMKDQAGNTISGIYGLIGPKGDLKIVKPQQARIKTGNGLMDDQPEFIGTLDEYKKWLNENKEAEQTQPSKESTSPNAPGKQSIEMTDRQGLRVRVPKDQVEKWKQKGYKE